MKKNNVWRFAKAFWGTPEYIDKAVKNWFEYFESIHKNVKIIEYICFVNEDNYKEVLYYVEFEKK